METAKFSSKKLRVEEFSFEEVHDTFTILESRIFITLKELFPNIANVIIHAEPSANK